MTALEKFRKIQILVSSGLFLAIFVFFTFFTRYDFTKIQLSHWGIVQDLGWIWNSLVITLSLSVYFNATQYVRNIPSLQNKTVIYIGFTFSCLCLFLTGLFNMNHQIHTASAYLYFFTFPVSVYIISYFNADHLPYREWLGHIIFASATFVIPIIFFKMFTGMAIAETIHSVLTIAWNIWIMPKKK